MKISYESKVQKASRAVDTETVTATLAFLETFFKLYSAVEKSSPIMCRANLRLINKDYLYLELINPVFTQDGEM